MHFVKHRPHATLLALTLQLSIGVSAESVITTCPVCLDYQVIGACVWMTCTPVGCSFTPNIDSLILL